MIIEEWRYRRNPHGKVGKPVMLNLRLTPRDGHKPTAAEVRDALQDVINNGAAPDGWKLSGIEWQSGRAFARGHWRKGTAEDVSALGAVIQSSEPRINIERRTRIQRQREYRHKSRKTGRFVKQSYAEKHRRECYPVTYDIEYEVEWWEAEIGVDYSAA